MPAPAVAGVVWERVPAWAQAGAVVVLLRGGRLEMVGVGNPSAALGKPGRPAPALVTTLDAPPVLTLKEGVYRRAWASPHVKVYRLKGK